MITSTPLVVLGGNGSVGRYFMQHLVTAGLTASVISRRPLEVPEGFVKIRTDLSGSSDWTAPREAVVISFLPLWLLADFLPHLLGTKALIATSSTSRFSKANSSDAHERLIAEKLEKAETKIQTWAEKNSVSWTILRPTLIYDCASDKNITRMARFIRRWHFLPIAAPAIGLRQPIHADDVAKAAFLCLNNPAVANKAFNISGGEVLSYRAMAERVFIALGLKPRFILLPTKLLQKVFCAATKIGIIKETSFGATVFQRMNEDLVFDTAEGLEILNYQPRLFNPTFLQMLKQKRRLPTKESTLKLLNDIANSFPINKFRNRHLSWYMNLPARVLKRVIFEVRQNKEEIRHVISKNTLSLRSASYRRIAKDVTKAFAKTPTSTVLYVSHNWGGGIQRYINDRVGELRQINRDILIVVPTEAGSATAQLSAPNGIYALAKTSRFDFTSKPEKLRRLFGLLKIDQIEIHSTAGWSSEILRALPRICLACKIPYTIMVHDYVALCPTSLIDNSGAYCREPDLEQCAICISLGDKTPYSVHPDLINQGTLNISHWRTLYGCFLSGAAQVFAPSEDAAKRIRNYFNEVDIIVRPHRENLVIRKITSAPRFRDGMRLKVTVIGFINRHKGFDVLMGCAKDARRRSLPLDFSVVGHTCDDNAARNENITVTGQYDDSEVYDLLEAEQAHIVFLPSVWLETYCYTLSIALATELPVVVFDIGAQAERVKAGAVEGLCLPLDVAHRSDIINDELLQFGKRIENLGTSRKS